MPEAKIKSVQCFSMSGLHQMAYKEWGEEDNPNVLVCVHGVTRVSDDFNNLAKSLCKDYRVVCPDVVGRGRSGKLRDPQLYRISQYASDMRPCWHARSHPVSARPWTGSARRWVA